MPDLINGVFEIVAGMLVWLNVRQLLIDKQLKGVSISATAFFTLWGYWNLYYYPALDQWISFAGGVLIVIANTVWIILIFKVQYESSRFPDN